MKNKCDGSIKYRVIRNTGGCFSLKVTINEVIVEAPEAFPDDFIERYVYSKKKEIEKARKVILEKEKIKSEVKQLSDREIENLIEKASLVIPERISYFAPLIGVSPNKVRIKKCLKSQWGSCSSKGNLNFNCMIMLAPPEVVDYVVVHELCHLKEMNHSWRFYNEVSKVFPDYWECEKWLKDNSLRLDMMVS